MYFIDIYPYVAERWETLSEECPGTAELDHQVETNSGEFSQFTAKQQIITK